MKTSEEKLESLVLDIASKISPSLVGLCASLPVVDCQVFITGQPHLEIELRVTLSAEGKRES